MGVGEVRPKGRGTARVRMDADQRRRQILTAAAQMFGRSGYDSIGMDAIGAAVGISGPAIYRHFPSKQDILIALLEEAIDRAIDEIGQGVETSGDPIETLAAELVAHSLSGRTMVGLVQGRSAEPTPEQRARLEIQRRRLTSHIEAIIARARPDAGSLAMQAECALALVRHVAAQPVPDAAAEAAYVQIVSAVLRS